MPMIKIVIINEDNSYDNKNNCSNNSHMLFQLMITIRITLIGVMVSYGVIHDQKYWRFSFSEL